MVEVCAAPAEAEVGWQDLYSRDNLQLTLTFGAMEVAVRGAGVEPAVT